MCYGNKKAQDGRGIRNKPVGVSCRLCQQRNPALGSEPVPSSLFSSRPDCAELVHSCLHLAGHTWFSMMHYLRQGLKSHFPNSPQIPEGHLESIAMFGCRTLLISVDEGIPVLAWHSLPYAATAVIFSFIIFLLCMFIWGIPVPSSCSVQHTTQAVAAVVASAKWMFANNAFLSGCSSYLLNVFVISSIPFPL